MRGNEGKRNLSVELAAKGAGQDGKDSKGGRNTSIPPANQLQSPKRNYGRTAECIKYEKFREIRRLLGENLKLCASAYKSVKALRVRIVTWNVGEGKPPAHGLAELLVGATAIQNGEPPPDIIAVGLQEIDMSLSAAAMEKTPAGEKWAQAIQGSLRMLEGFCCSYVPIDQAQCMGLFLMLIVKSELACHCRHVKRSIVKCGAGGKVGNKGSISMRLSMFGKTLCFVVAHFWAHQNEVERRNQNFHQIMKETVFPVHPDADDALDLDISKTSLLLKWKKFTLGKPPTAYPPKQFAISSHDYVFWCGDLNYRLDIDTAAIPAILNMIRDNEVLQLRAHDQLKISKDKGKVFDNFQEGEITFRPTYKYYKATNEYYQNPEKPRVPGWTDRVLFLVNEEGCDWEDTLSNSVLQTAYDRIEFTHSDHRPVYATFDVKFADVKEDLFNDVFPRIFEQTKNESLYGAASPPTRFTENPEAVLSAGVEAEDAESPLQGTCASSVPWTRKTFIGELEYKSAEVASPPCRGEVAPVLLEKHSRKSMRSSEEPEWVSEPRYDDAVSVISQGDSEDESCASVGKRNSIRSRSDTRISTEPTRANSVVPAQQPRDAQPVIEEMPSEMCEPTQDLQSLLDDVNELLQNTQFHYSQVSRSGASSKVQNGKDWSKKVREKPITLQSQPSLGSINDTINVLVKGIDSVQNAMHSNNSVCCQARLTAEILEKKSEASMQVSQQKNAELKALLRASRQRLDSMISAPSVAKVQEERNRSPGKRSGMEDLVRRETSKVVGLEILTSTATPAAAGDVLHRFSSLMDESSLARIAEALSPTDPEVYLSSINATKTNENSAWRSLNEWSKQSFSSALQTDIDWVEKKIQVLEVSLAEEKRRNRPLSLVHCSQEI